MPDDPRPPQAAPPPDGAAQGTVPEGAENFEHTLKKLIAARDAARQDKAGLYR